MVLNYKELSRAFLEKDVSRPTVDKIVAEMEGKTDEEKNEIMRKYAKIIMETYPPREKGNSR